jgi:cell division protein FtsN
VVNGNGSAGRLLVDSVLSATPYSSPVYGEALYWRVALAVSSADAERDYRRLIVEYPLSAHVGEALFQLAQLESARGDRASASQHLEQFLADNPKSADRPRATLLYVRLLSEQNELPRGCSMLRQAINEIPDSAVETRNQLEYYLPRCAASDVTSGGAAPVEQPTRDTAKSDMKRTAKTNAKAEPPARSDTPAKPEPAKNTATWKGRYTLQVAAYKSKAEAEALAKRLKGRKLDARVAASGKLYRVQVGQYPTRAGATAAQKELKAKKITAFVTEMNDR